MNVRLICPIAALAFVLAASAQDAPTAQQGPPPGQGQRVGGRGGWGGGMGMGRGVMGTVTEVAADHYTIKTETGETYVVHYSVNTRMMKMPNRTRGEGGQGGQDTAQRGSGEGGGFQGGGNPPTPIKPTDIKVGDAVGAMGEVDANAKSVGAVMVMQIDPERARQMREMQANFGKTWLAGKVTAIDGVKVTIMGGVDNASHTFTADENTTFRKRRDPITLGDIQVGDSVRVDGAMKDGAFLATTVSAMGPPPAGAPNGERQGPPPQ